jgi:hypothetical protein
MDHGRLEIRDRTILFAGPWSEKPPSLVRCTDAGTGFAVRVLHLTRNPRQDKTIDAESR